MESRTALLSAAIVLLLAGCTRPTPAPAVADAATAPPTASAGLRYGAVMSEVGRRFELAGRASVAGRFELAEFEVGELGELFDDDLPRAELPKEGPTGALPALADAFAKTVPPDLRKAAKAKDARAFTDAFGRAAATCNACHQAAGKAFIQVPSVPGTSVPELEPTGAPTSLPTASPPPLPKAPPARATSKNPGFGF
jgi:hypothetical protein